MSIQKILTPTDFSPSAEAGVEVAFSLAKKLNAEICFLHIHEDMDELEHVPLRHAVSKSSSLVVVHAEMDKLITKARHAGISATTLLIHDRGNEKIEDYISANHIDLIVMGTHGIRGIREFITGSNAQYVLHHAPVPMIVVKQISEENEFKEILFASRFDERVAVPLSFIVSLAEVFQATIHLLFVSRLIQPTGEENAKAQIREVIRQFPQVNFTLNYSETNDEELAIDQFAQEVGADLIALTTHDQQGLLKILSRSVAENLVNHEELPVLVIPETYA